jgi:hypothetical protein
MIFIPIFSEISGPFEATEIPEFKRRLWRRKS